MLQFPNYLKIISGGQTGVDRAALDFALQNNMPCGGWCPKGRFGEDGIIADKYPMKETSSSDSKERTEKNIMDSDATLIIFNHKFDSGTKLTYELCMKYHKPILQINLNDNIKSDKISQWICDHHIKILNIAGPRESNSPGIYNKTLNILNYLFESS